MQKQCYSKLVLLSLHASSAEMCSIKLIRILWNESVSEATWHNILPSLQILVRSGIKEMLQTLDTERIKLSPTSLCNMTYVVAQVK